MPNDRFGDAVNDLGLFAKLRLLLEWAPLLGRLEDLVREEDPHIRAVKILEAARWAADKTENAVDDEVIGHLEAVLKSPEGEALFNYIVEKVRALT